MRRVVHKEEPTIKIHGYVAVLYPTKSKRQFRYLGNRQEIRELKRKMKPGTYMEVFKATHDFKEAWLAD